MCVRVTRTVCASYAYCACVLLLRLLCVCVSYYYCVCPTAAPDCVFRETWLIRRGRLLHVLGGVIDFENML